MAIKTGWEKDAEKEKAKLNEDGAEKDKTLWDLFKNYIENKDEDKKQRLVQALE